MRPIGLTFKYEGYGRQGEIMLVHECSACGKLSINRIAGDDSNDRIITVFNSSLSNSVMSRNLKKEGIQLLTIDDEKENTNAAVRK